MRAFLQFHDSCRFGKLPLAISCNGLGSIHVDIGTLIIPTARLRPHHRRGRPRDEQMGRPRADALSAGAERLSAHRPRQEHLPELRPRPGVRRQVQPALRRHQSDQGRGGIRRVDPGGRALAGLRVGRPAVLRLRLLRAALRVGRPADQGGQGLRLRPDGRPDARAIAARSPRRARTARIATAASRRISTCSSG